MSWLRVVTYSLPETDTEQALEGLRAGSESVVRILEDQPGFGGAYWGESPEENTVSAITHWSSLAAIEAAEPALARVRAQRESVADGIAVLEVHNVGLFAVPAVSMWFDDDEPRVFAERQDYMQLYPRRFARWRR
ncbi:MAG TPA: hypothetical protein VHU88_18720 [Sporichthyaceae bacterium]|nr:hypothetical protein [Sporichthyaceae bacterium]